MAYPEYEDMANALLQLIFQQGGANYELHASQTYAPLADFFGLSQADRTDPRPDGHAGTAWENRVQWTRQRLINEGYAESRGYGMWGLTAKGVTRARTSDSVQGRQEPSS